MKTKATDPKEEKPDGKTIIYERTTETDKSTTGKFWIEGTDIEGYMLEPAGPSTTERNTGRRIPAGTYNLEPFSGDKFKNVLRLYNDQVSQKRTILIHAGRNVGDSRGCLMPGPAIETTTRLGGPRFSSRVTVKQIVGHFNNVGYDGAKMIIRNSIATTNQSLKK